MRTRNWLLLLIVTSLLNGCTSIQCGANKGQFLEQFDRFIHEAELAGKDVIESPWKVYDEQLEVYVLDCYDNFRDEMSWSDRTAVIVNTLKYYNWRYGSHMVFQLRDSENAVSAYLLKEIKAIHEEGGEDMAEIMEEEWIEITNVFLEDLDGLRRQLLETLEDD
jgi:hypothetical protein